MVVFISTTTVTNIKSFNAQDGHGIKMLRQTGVEIAVISGRKSVVVAKRMHDLGITHVYLGYDDKRVALSELLEKLALSPQQAAHVGDDVLDLPIMSRVGLGVAVADANFAVQHYADACTTRTGGQGAVREVCDFILQAQGHFDALIAAYLA
ncbi:KdsC family phosphatase [Methylocucumis oryzae]|uniref:KdsC family phosphatase n=1 Tax=Methylocucumis oryzae TaxID=1632867 RepID=UPI000AEFAB63